MSAKDLSDKILWRAKYARECSKRFQAHQILPYILTPPSLPNVPSPRPPVYSDRPPLHDVPAPIPIISSSVTTPGAGEAGDVPALRAAAAATAEDPNNLVVGIIGAGVAGLYTAMILKDLGINYKIIEGSDRSGGRILTHHFTESDNEWNYFDVGAMRYPDIKVMWRVFDLFRNRLNIGDRLISYIMKSPNQFLDYNRQLVQQRDYDGAPHSADKFKDSENNDGLVPQEFVDQGVDHWLGQCFGPFKTLFAEDWQRGWDKLMEYDGYSARSFMATEFNDRDGEFVLQKPKYDNAVINWMERMNTGTGLFDMAFSEMVIDDLQFDWPNSSGVKYGAAADPDGQWYCLRGGSEVFIRAMENTLQTSIQFNKRVTKIEPTPKGVPGRPMTVTYSQNKVKATADFDYVVSTVPLPALRFVDLEYCNLSYAQLEGMRTLRYDSSCKVGIRFSSRWWKDLPTGQIVGGQSKTDRIIRTAVFPSYGVSTGGSGEPTRLNREKRKLREESSDHAKTMDLNYEGLLNRSGELEATLEKREHKYRTHTTTLQQANSQLELNLIEARSKIKDLRQEVQHLLTRLSRAQLSLHSSRQTLARMGKWSPTRKGMYTSAARRLARELCAAGCAEEKVPDAIDACARVFGVTVTRRMSRRTVSRAKQEGGVFALVQAAREIKFADGFGESSDGTTHRKCTKESRQITLAVPTYVEGVDDSDQNTWTFETRFLEVAPAVDHTAVSQLQGSQELAKSLAETYSASPLAIRDGVKMTIDDYVRKQTFQNMDHAADGRKKFRLTEKWKKQVAFRDLGSEIMDEMSHSELLQAVNAITEEEIAAALEDYPGLDVSSEENSTSLAHSVLELKLGKIAFEKLDPDEQQETGSLTFGGCGAHKDINAYKYGVAKMDSTYDELGITPPVLLANKANDATIRLGKDADSDAVQNAVESSSRGGHKLTQLTGALYNNREERKGYQDVHRAFMSKVKLEDYGVKSDTKYPDVNNTRYLSHTRAAGELITYLPGYQNLMLDTRDSKVKPGFNHLEANVWKGLNDGPTLTQLATMALYGEVLSWRYLPIVRGNGTLRNLFDPELVTLHRRLPGFCDNIAAKPHLLLDPNAPLSEVTIDGKPISNHLLLSSIRNLQQKNMLPDLELIISRMFSGAAGGWRIFTEEFHEGGTYDSLTPRQRVSLFIPATNDANEGALGAFRVFIRYHPNSTERNFSDRMRAQHNNTENFIAKVCNDDDQLYVSRLVRIRDASGETKKFREKLLAAQRARAEATRLKEQIKEQKNITKLTRLAQVGLQIDRQVISKMTLPQLQDQIDIHILFLGDEILKKLPKGEIRRRDPRLTALLAAVDRNESRMRVLEELISEARNNSTVGDVLGVVSGSQGRGNDGEMSDDDDPDE